MANFKYKAKSTNGEEVTGVIEADDQFAAVAKIKQTCPIILEIVEAGGGEVEKKQYTLKKMKAKELSLLCDRFATLLNVGLPIVQSVDMLARQMDDKNISLLLQDISQDVAMGRSLYAAFSSKEGVFPTTFLESIKSGEDSGDLVNTFKRLKTYYERSSKTSQKVVSALTYPAITAVVAVVVVIVIMVVAVPSFSRTFESMGTEMPWITKMMISMSNFFINYGVLLLMVIAALILAARLYMRTEKGAETFAALAISFPLIGKIVQLSAASQFAHTMAMMIASGMPILSCLQTAGRGMSNYVMRRDILGAVEDVEEGSSLGNALGKSQYLPAMLVEMTAMGESTGTLETTLEAVGEFYDNEVDLATTRAMSVLEPAIICVLAVVVVMILFSVYLPMFSMYGGMS